MGNSFQDYSLIQDFHEDVLSFSCIDVGLVERYFF